MFDWSPESVSLLSDCPLNILRPTMALASYGNQLRHNTVLNSHRTTQNTATSPSTSPAVEVSIASRPSFQLVWDYISKYWSVARLEPSSVCLPTLSQMSVYCAVTCSTVLALHGFTIEKDVRHFLSCPKDSTLTTLDSGLVFVHSLKSSHQQDTYAGAAGS